MQSVRVFDRRLFFAFVVCSLAAIFYLPRFVPTPPSVSSSYIFGYNNRAGVLLLLIFAAIGAIWTKGFGLQPATSGHARPVPRKTLVCSLIGVLVGCLTMYCIVGRFTGFGESSYEIDRIWLTSQGKIPYVDFEWPFGAALLYGPVWVQRLTHVDLIQAYYLFWGFNWFVGTLLLYTVVNLVDYPTQFKHSIFWLLYTGGILSILCAGTHYSFLRFTCPLFFILLVHRALIRFPQRPEVFAAGLADMFTIVLLLISPETALGYVFACICIFLFSAPNRKFRYVATILGFVVATAGVFEIAVRLHVLDTMKASSGGADSFPIIPAPHILLFFVTFFICGCYLVRRFSDSRIDDNTIGLIAFSIVMLAATLGRCDPLHIFWDGEGVFLAGMFYVSSYRNLWNWYRAVFIVVMLLISNASFARGYLPFVKTAIVDTVGVTSDPSIIRRSVTYFGQRYVAAFVSPTASAKWQRIFEQAQSATPQRLRLASLYPRWRGTYFAPFGYRPDGLGTFLSDQVEYGHFEGFENANTEAATEAKLKEIIDRPEMALLLPDNFQDSCSVNVWGRKRAISELFSFPYFAKAIHPESIRRPICRYILDHYITEEQPGPQNFRYGLWILKRSYATGN